MPVQRRCASDWDEKANPLAAGYRSVVSTPVYGRAVPSPEVGPMTTQRLARPQLTIGLDLGDRFTQLCAVDARGRARAPSRPVSRRAAPRSCRCRSPSAPPRSSSAGSSRGIAPGPAPAARSALPAPGTRRVAPSPAGCMKTCSRPWRSGYASTPRCSPSENASPSTPTAP